MSKIVGYQVNPNDFAVVARKSNGDLVVLHRGLTEREADTIRSKSGRNVVVMPEFVLDKQKNIVEDVRYTPGGGVRVFEPNSRMKHSPQIALQAARRELELAREECPHWDYESDGGHGEYIYECCYRVDDAKHAYKEAKRRVEKAEGVRRNGSSLDESIKIRENFRDEPHKKQFTPGWHWPTMMQEIGDCEAVMYRSNKWQKDGKEHDYKHVKEGEQKIMIVPGTKSSGDKTSFKGPTVNMRGEFPDSFAVLAKSISVQARLYKDVHGKNLGDYVDLKWPGSTLGAGRFADGGTFLVIYDRDGVLAVVIGEKLDVLKDGIVG